MFVVTNDSVPEELVTECSRNGYAVIVVSSSDRAAFRQRFSVELLEDDCVIARKGSVVSKVYKMGDWVSCLHKIRLWAESVVVLGDPMDKEFAQHLAADITKACMYARLPPDQISSFLELALASQRVTNDFVNTFGKPARLTILNSPTRSDLLDFLAQWMTDITTAETSIQFCGHGNADGTFVLQDLDLYVGDLHEVLVTSAKQWRLQGDVDVFFNCCFGDELLVRFADVDTNFIEAMEKLPENEVMNAQAYESLRIYRIHLETLQGDGCAALFPKIAGKGTIPLDGGFHRLLGLPDDSFASYAARMEGLTRAVAQTMQPNCYTLTQTPKALAYQPGFYIIAYNVGCGDAATVLKQDRKGSVAVQIDGGRITLSRSAQRQFCWSLKKPRYRSYFDTL
eukprot:TRINITY_DN401_c0_g1_i1.p1 TRINITY_DN401_c0_g1~~TRINITY_DN401_c0_g1_i1.p1  ORF type:complete len:397 (-),score=37.69 TRINITY_DN401_c0_g1_i1:514-1704(-)